MITLYQLPPAYGLSLSVSPFCAKLECYLRFCNIEYQTAAADVRKAPNGKVPYIEHEGMQMGDSGKIIAWCKKTFGDPLDGALTAEQRHMGHLIQRTVEEHLYWSLIYSRFIDEEGWTVQKTDVINKQIPAFLRPILPTIIRNSIIKSAKGHGLARLPQEEVYQAGVADLQAVVAMLGDKPFLLGDTPTSYDCAFYGSVRQILTTKSENALTSAAKGMSTVAAYVARMEEKLAF